MLATKLDLFIQRYEELSILLCDSSITSDIKKLTNLSKEQSEIEPIVEKSRIYKKLIDDIQSNKDLLLDDELADLAKEELKVLEEQKPQLEATIKLLLLPKDPNDGKNIFLEIRAGTGGEEAAIFVGDLFRSYLRYAQDQGWKAQIISSSESDLNGYKEIILSIKGDKVYSKLKHESGTHRVQRIPQTESQGRVHTSAVTVAVIPEVDDVQVDINPNDLKIDVFRSSGNGGQSVNTTDSAVRITHIPTGIVVSMQDEKSQHKNKNKALKILKSRIYDNQLQEQQSKISEDRRTQVGSGDRSERIRTYNFPQNRITDHRIGLSLYRLQEILTNGYLDEIISPIITHYQASLLEQEVI